MIDQKTNLDLIPGGGPKIVRVSQYDHDSRNIIITLFNNKSAYTIPTGTTVQVRGTKPSGKGFLYSCSFNSNVVTVVVKDQMTAESGKVKCEIVLINGNAILGSANFELWVERSSFDPGTVISSDTFESLVEDAVVKCVNEKLIELYVDVELSETSEAPVANKVVTAELKNMRNNLASAIKGRKCGSVVVADDVSPFEHNPIVKVHSKNLIPFPYAKNNITMAGATFTQKDDGGVLVSGTPTAYSSIAIYDGDPLVTKGKITFSLHGEFSNVNGALVLYGESNNVLLEKEIRKGANSYVVDLDSYPTISKWLIHLKRSTNGLEMSGTAYPQIEIGETATDYLKYFDPTTISVKKCGKNLYDVGKIGDYHIISNVTISNNIINGTVISSNGGHCINLKNKLPNGKLGISFNYSDTTPRLLIRPYDKNGNVITECSELIKLGFQYNESYNAFFANSKAIVVTIPDYVAYWCLGFVFPVSDTAPINTVVKVSNIQVEYKDEITYYEKSNIVEYAPTSNGEILGVVSDSPNMTVLTDNKNVVIECEYIRDSTKVVNKIIDAITALGGTV